MEASDGHTLSSDSSSPPSSSRGLGLGIYGAQDDEQQQQYGDGREASVDGYDGQRQHHYSEHHQHSHGGMDVDVDQQEEDEEDDDDLSSSPSIPDEHIDFDLVYALHTFLATVEGQASVVKGDSLTLLDDSNSYWWLVRVLKTQAVGYIPAENIETPFERLARLNKHRNVDLTFATPDDRMNGTGSSLAQTRFAQPHHPSNRSLKQTSHRPPVQLNPTLAGGGRFVDFAPPIYHEHEGYEYSDSPDEGEEEDEDEGYDEDEDQDLEAGSGDENLIARAHEGSGSNASDDEGSEGSFQGGSVHDLEDSSVLDAAPGRHIMEEVRKTQSANGVQGGENDGTQQNETRGVLRPISPNGPVTPGGRAAQAQKQAALGVGLPAAVQATYGASPQLQQTGFQSGPSGPAQGAPQPTRAVVTRKPSVDEQLRAEREAAAVQDRANTTEAQPGARRSASSSSLTGGKTGEQTPQTTISTSSRLKPFVDEHGEITGGKARSPDGSQLPTFETRKISLTPSIARDDSQESDLSKRGLSPTPSATGNVQSDSKHQPRRTYSNASAHLDDSPVGQPTQPQNASDDGHHTVIDHFRRGSGGSAATASSTASAASTKDSKRSTSPGNTPAEPQSKKKKSTGILGGLFSRSKKDKKEKEKPEEKKTLTRRKSSTSSVTDEDSKAADSPTSAAADRSGSTTPMQGVGIVTQQLQQRRAKEAAREGLFGAEAALRQQQVEAQAAMYQQYGIHPRGPGEVTNTSTFPGSRSSSQNNGSSSTSAQQMTLSPSSASSHLSLGSSVNGKPRRPGSLIGSPHMAGMGRQAGADAPNLSVLRIFAGENIPSDATFKTVLLTETTTTEDLVKQAMQRFHLPPPASAVAADGKLDTASLLEEYYLTTKEVSGDETVLTTGQKPLKIFEHLSQASGFAPAGLPSVKRSSVGSINSIASNLSLNPAIERLRMSDFSDDSAVKLFINRRSAEPGSSAENEPETKNAESVSNRSSMDSQSTVRDNNRLSATGSIIDKGLAPGMPASPLLRFAARIVIHPEDLPESMVFDPLSPQIIPKSTLAGRQQGSRSPLMQSQPPNPAYREKVIFFPRNANVSEILETALDRFGIVEGVVDGGDDVEDKLSKRRSINRVRYTVAVRIEDATGQAESLLGPSTKAIDAYKVPPLYRHYERNSKEFRRRSMDMAYNLPTGSDLQSSDPVFVIRRAGNKGLHSNKSSVDASPLTESPKQRSTAQPADDALAASASSQSLYATPTGGVLQEPEHDRQSALSRSPPSTTASGASSADARPTMKTKPAARKNSKAGVDVIMPDRATIRSSRDAYNHTRYSYIAPDGAETDISEIVESEWTGNGTARPVDVTHSPASASGVPLRDTASVMSHATSDSFASALSSPMTPYNLPGSLHEAMHTSDVSDAEDSSAVQNLANARVTVDASGYNHKSRDYLQDALGTTDGTGNVGEAALSGPETLEERLDRVLARVRAGGTGGGGLASALRSQSQLSSAATSPTPVPSATFPSDDLSGRSTPSALAHVSRVSGQAGSDDALKQRPTASSTTSPESHQSAQRSTRNRSGSTTSTSTTGRNSVLAAAVSEPAEASSSSRTIAQPEAPPSSVSSTPKRQLPASRGHNKQSSLASLASDSSSAAGASPTTFTTTSVGNTTLTPVSSTRNDSVLADSTNRIPVPYREDHSLDFLFSLVDAASLSSQGIRSVRPVRAKIDVLSMFDDVDHPTLTSEEARTAYMTSRNKLDDLDKRLDQLLNQTLA